MLALTRRIGEEIVLSKDGKKIATVRVVSVRGDKVRLSWDAPDWVQIDRLELWDEKERDKREANGQ